MLYNIGYTYTAVIYCQFTVITKVMLLYNTEWQYDHGMAVNYRGKKFYNTGPWYHFFLSFIAEQERLSVKLRCCLSLPPKCNICYLHYFDQKKLASDIHSSLFSIDRGIENIYTGIPYERGRLSTADLLVLTSLDQLFLWWEHYLPFFIKQATLITSLPLQFMFPDLYEMHPNCFS